MPGARELLRVEGGAIESNMGFRKIILQKYGGHIDRDGHAREAGRHSAYIAIIQVINGKDLKNR